MRSRFLTFALFASLTLLPLACSDDDDPETLTIGALLPLTGALSSTGEASRAVLEDVVATINAGDGADVELIVEDTTTVPAVAAQKLVTLKDRGVRLVIGPFASSEVREVKSYADQNGIILVSPLSTSTALAIADDNVLRFTPDDYQEAVAVANFAYTDGVRALIPVNRDDEGNKGLQISVKALFEQMGGRVLPGLTYPANETDFVDEVRTLEGLVRSAASGGEKFAIYLTAFGEVANLFAAATNSDALRTTDWIGSDGVVQIRELIDNTAAAGFAAGLDYPSPILGLAEDDRSLWQPVSDRVEAKIGRAPDAFALAAYDGFIVGHEALEAVGSDADVATLRQEIIKIAESHRGLTGSTRLNPAGDRALGNYDFWAVCRSGTVFEWRRVATFTAPTGSGQGTVRRLGC